MICFGVIAVAHGWNMWRVFRREFSIEHGMKLTSDTDMGISFFNKSMDLAVTLQGEELDQCFTNTDLILVQ